MHDAVDGYPGGHGVGEDMLPLGEDQNRRDCKPRSDLLLTQLFALQSPTREIHMTVARDFLDLRSRRSQFQALMSEALRDDPAFQSILVLGMEQFFDSKFEMQELPDLLAARGVKVVAVAQNGTR